LKTTIIGILIPNEAIPQYSPDKVCNEIYLKCGGSNSVEFTVMFLNKILIHDLIDWLNSVHGLLLTGSWQNITNLLYNNDCLFRKLLTLMVYLIERDRSNTTALPVLCNCFSCQLLALAIILHNKISDINFEKRINDYERFFIIEKAILGLSKRENIDAFNPVSSALKSEHGIFFIEKQSLIAIQSHWAFNGTRHIDRFEVLQAHTCWIDDEILKSHAKNVTTVAKIGPDYRAKVDLFFIDWKKNTECHSRILGTQFHCDLTAKVLYEWFVDFEDQFLKEVGFLPIDLPAVKRMKEYFGKPTGGNYIFKNFVDTSSYCNLKKRE
jgi:hypothetical protein